MELVNTADRLDLDDVVREAFKVAKDRDNPLRIRVQPTVYNAERADHVLWPGIVWTLLCTSLEEVRQLRKALDEFFSAIVRGGPAAVVEALKGVPTNG